jgi:hypothetical protein
MGRGAVSWSDVDHATEASYLTVLPSIHDAKTLFLAVLHRAMNEDATAGVAPATKSVAEKGGHND